MNADAEESPSTSIGEEKEKEGEIKHAERK